MDSDVLERIEKKAAQYEYNHHGCGQCVLLSLLEELDLPREPSILKAAGFTGAGIARMQDMCGALMAGMMAIGIVAGRGDIHDPVFSGPVEESSGLPKVLVIARRFYSRFVHQYGSWVCREIQENQMGRTYDLAIPEEYAKFEKAGGYEVCSRVAGTCARMAGETILELKRELGEMRTDDVDP
jgi:C_GCAxxG_C_C family probable redox protein